MWSVVKLSFKSSHISFLFVLCLLKENYAQVPLPTSGVPLGVGSHTTQGQPALPILNTPVGVPLPAHDNSHLGVPLPAHGNSPVGVPLPTHGQEQINIVPLGGGPIGTGAPYIPVANPGGGGLKAIADPISDKGVLKLIQHPLVVKRIQHETKADSAVKIGKLITASRQVVSGQMTYLSLQVHETLCPLGTVDVLPCQEDTTEDPYICEIAVWERAWLNSTKVIDEKTRCEEMEDDADFKVRKHIQSLPPLSRFAKPLNQLPKELDAKQIAVEAFNFINLGSDSDFEGRMLNFNVNNIMFDPAHNMTRVRVNVEYGFTLCLKTNTKRSLVRQCPPDNSRVNYICSVTVIDNPNDLMRLQVLPDHDDDDISCVKKGKLDEELVIAVPSPCVGCPQPAPLNDPVLVEIAKFAVTEFDRNSDDDDLHMVLKLVKANKQVASGVKYFLTLEVAETTCNKRLTGADVNRTLCKQDLTEETKLCDLHVIDQAWIPARDLVYGKCYDKNSYPSAENDDEFIIPVATLPSSRGPSKPLNLDAAAQAAVDYVVSEYNRKEVEDVDDAYYKLVKVHESSSQPSNVGLQRHLVVELGETNCFPNVAHAHVNLNNCSLNPWEEHEVCEVRLVEQNSQSGIQRRFTYLDCDDLDDYLYKKTAKSIQSFSKQNTPFINSGKSAPVNDGTKQSTDDPIVKKMASYVVEQFNLQSDEDEVYILSHILSATTKQQAGIKYILEIEMAETRCKKYQPIADPSRCPVDYSEEPQVCQAEVNVVQGMPQSLGRLYCDERDDYYIHRIAAKVGATVPSHHNPASSDGPTIKETTNWPAVDVNSRKLLKLGEFVADEFDLRSDEDNVYVMSKLHTAKQQVESGLNYYLVVEIAETVCPKYKQGINKTRCSIDIGEEHKMCEAIVQEQAWINKRQVIELQCADIDDFYKGDDSKEILYPNVHPTAHARPVYMSHLTKPTKTFRGRGQESKESQESNEFNKQRNYSFESAESNEKYYKHQPAQQPNHPLAPFFQYNDSDEGYDSDESRHWFRGKRSLLAGGLTEQDITSPTIQDLATFAVAENDKTTNDLRLRKVSEIISAKSQIVAGTLYHLKLRIHWTDCMKASPVDDIQLCSVDSNSPELICTAKIWVKPWENFKQVTSFECE